MSKHLAKQGSKSASVRKYSYEKLEKWADKQVDNKGQRLYSPADIIDRLIVNFLIDIDDDAELKALEKAYKAAASKTKEDIR